MSKISVSMCSILSLAVSSLTFVISLIPSSKGTYLYLFLQDQVFSSFHVQISFSAGIQNQSQALLLMLMFDFWLWEQSGLHFDHPSLCTHIEKGNAE